MFWVGKWVPWLEMWTVAWSYNRTISQFLFLGEKEQGDVPGLCLNLAISAAQVLPVLDGTGPAPAAAEKGEQRREAGIAGFLGLGHRSEEPRALQLSGAKQPTAREETGLTESLQNAAGRVLLPLRADTILVPQGVGNLGTPGDSPLDAAMAISRGAFSSGQGISPFPDCFLSSRHQSKWGRIGKTGFRSGMWRP